MQNKLLASGSLALRQAMAYLRPSCMALLTPQAVLLEISKSQRPLVRPCPATTVGAEPSMQQAAQLLLEMLDAASVQGKKIHIHISEAWVKPLGLPFPAKSSRPEDVQLVLQSQYRKVYGDLAEHLHISWEHHNGRLWAAALPNRPLVALQQGMAQRANVLASVVPLSTVVAKTALADHATSWLLVQEPQNITLVYVENGAWRHWCVVPAMVTDPVGTVQILEREAARMHNPCRNISLLAIGPRQQAQALEPVLKSAGWITKSQVYRLSEALSAGSIA